MNENKEPNVATNSVEFKRGVDAGLGSGVDTRNWKAGNKLGQELKEERVTKKLNYEPPVSEPPTPLFMESSSSGQKGNAQDEKDTTEE